MLGYSVTINEIGGTISEADFALMRELSYPESVNSMDKFLLRPGIHVSSCTRVDAILECTEDGRAQLVHGGGYPYLVFARGTDVAAAFARELSEAGGAIDNETWYMVEAWDQS